MFWKNRCKVVHSGAQECTKCTSFLTLSVKLESWNLVWILELKFHKLSYQPYFEKNRCTVVHWSAQECTMCTFFLTFLSAKLESWNLVWMLELKFHKLSYQPYFEKNRCAVVHRSAQECTKCTFSLTFLSAKLESWNLVWMLE